MNAKGSRLAPWIKHEERVYTKVRDSCFWSFSFLFWTRVLYYASQGAEVYCGSYDSQYHALSNLLQSFQALDMMPTKWSSLSMEDETAA